jgi:PST family polysaccharide transporter
MIFRKYSLRSPQWNDALRMLREGFAMFVFRSSHNLYVLGNAFVLGLFAPASDVGYYAGAEKLNSAAVGLLSPLSTALYPRAVNLAKTALGRAARLTVVSTYVVLAASCVLALTMWFGAHEMISLVLGSKYRPAENVLKLLALRAPLVAWTNVLGFQWLLALGLETPFQRVTLAALVLNLVLAACLAPRFTYEGMSWAVLISQLVVAVGIFIVLQRRGLNPFSMPLNAEPSNS